MEITGGASTTSRRPERMLTNQSTVFAIGNRITSESGQVLVDHSGGLAGPIFEFNPFFWQSAIVDELTTGAATVTSLVSGREQATADLLAQFYPFESVRWFCNGSDHCAAAVKLARAITSRDRILSFGYHGTASAFCAPPEEIGRPNLAPIIDMRRGTLQAERDAYIPLDWEPVAVLQGSRYRELDKISGEVAAVIVECPPVDGGSDSTSHFLQSLANTAHERGALFILDEVVTGFRYAQGGAMEYYGLSPKEVDLLCLGKTLGNGFPISALLGHKAIMDELTNGVHWSSTFSGYPMGLAAAYATLTQIRDRLPFSYLATIGDYLKKQWNTLNIPWKLVGHPSRPVLRPENVKAERLERLRRDLFANGHLIVPHPWYVCTETTTSDVDDLVTKTRQWRESRW